MQYSMVFRTTCDGHAGELINQPLPKSKILLEVWHCWLELLKHFFLEQQTLLKLKKNSIYMCKALPVMQFGQIY